jgi:hypothetical protein
VPYDGGELVVRARQLQDFAGLNQRLTAGGVVGGRSFQIGEGDLRIGDEVGGAPVDISVDAGSLTVAGRIDASGEQVGSIRLYARDQLQVDGTLDAHGTGLRVDSHGKIIDSPNRATITLGSAEGAVGLGSAAQLDLRAGSDVAVGGRPGQNDGTPRGTLKIDVPRLGSNDAAIAAATGLRIDGAADIQLNGVRRYDDAPWQPPTCAATARSWSPSSGWTRWSIRTAWPGSMVRWATRICSSARGRWAMSAFVPACRCWRGAATPTRTAT